MAELKEERRSFTYLTTGSSGRQASVNDIPLYETCNSFGMPPAINLSVISFSPRRETYNEF
jgi:hypothetical protein